MRLFPVWFGFGETAHAHFVPCHRLFLLVSVEVLFENCVVHFHQLFLFLSLASTLNCFQFYMVERLSILFSKTERFALPWPNSQFMISKVMLDRFTSWMAQSNNHFYPIEEAEGQPAQRNLDYEILTRELKVRVFKDPLFSYLLQQNLAHFLNTCDPNSTPPGRGPVWSWGHV